MELRDALDTRIITVDLDVKCKDEALHKMAGILADNNYISDVDDFVEDIYLREKEGVTGIGNGVAIPHGKSKSVSRVGIAIANLKHPIEWETLDDKPVSTIFLFCVSDDGNFAIDHMILLSKVAGKLADDDLLLEIKNSKSAQNIKDLLTNE